MAKDSKIEWTHHTFNPWWGCRKVSPACLHCYAETWARRLALDLWGSKTPRRFFSDKHWAEPLKWNREAQRVGARRRVFCASMADVFEGRPELDEARARLWPLIEATPWLDWLLLTKRIHNVARMAPWGDAWPANVWLGTTVENQRWANRRVPILLSHNARVRFLSVEPLLGPVSIAHLIDTHEHRSKLHWLIAGGESGHGARPTHPYWIRSLRDECQTYGVAFHFKQWGHWAPSLPNGLSTKHQITLNDAKVGESLLYGLGKSGAGRELDGRTWDQFPA
jgi:protein gp37